MIRIGAFDRSTRFRLASSCFLIALSSLCSPQGWCQSKQESFVGQWHTSFGLTSDFTGSMLDFRRDKSLVIRLGNLSLTDYLGDYSVDDEGNLIIKIHTKRSRTWGKGDDEKVDIAIACRWAIDGHGKLLLVPLTFIDHEYFDDTLMLGFCYKSCRLKDNWENLEGEITTECVKNPPASIQLDVPSEGDGKDNDPPKAGDAPRL